jgi:transcriptional regulator with XRE-family HTH domain
LIDNEKIKVGQLIIEIRKNKKISQEDLAFNIGITRKQMSNIERDVHEPGLATIVKIAYALELGPPELFKLIEDAGLLEHLSLFVRTRMDK